MKDRPAFVHTRTLVETPKTPRPTRAALVREKLRGARPLVKGWEYSPVALVTSAATVAAATRWCRRRYRTDGPGRRSLCGTEGELIRHLSDPRKWLPPVDGVLSRNVTS
jgi:hypothetical protein